MNRATWLVTLLAAAALPARAADPEEQRAGDDDLGEEITVLAPSRLADAWHRSETAPTDVIDGKELQASGARTVQDALQRLAVVHLNDQQGNPFQQDVSVRGLTASPVTGMAQGLSVFLDGVRINEPTVEEVNFNLVPLEDVERIEIVRGPNAIFGRNTIGGAIHIITRRGGPKPDAEVEVEAGSWDHKGVRGWAGGSLGAFDGYLSLGEFTETGWRPQSGSRSFRALGKVGFREGGTDVALSYQFQIDRLQEAGSLPQSFLLENPRQNYTGGDFFQPTLHLVTLNARQRLAEGLSLAVNGFLRVLDAEQFNASWISPNTRLFDHAVTGGGAAQLEHRASLGPLRNRLLVGAEASHSSVTVRVNQEPNENFTTFEDVEPPVPLPALTADLHDSQLALGLFVQEHVRIAEGPLSGLGATAAVRFDRISHDIVDGSPYSPDQATQKHIFEAWVPSVGLGWAFTPRWLVSAFYSEGYRAPAFLELTCADPGSPCVGLQAGVAPDTGKGDLRPVRSRSYEVGVSATPVDGFTLAVSAFRIDLRDDIYSVRPEATTSVYFQNVGDTRRQGLEVAGRLERGILGVTASYAFVKSTFESEVLIATARTGESELVRPGSELPMSPRHRFDVEARVRALPWLTLLGGVRFTDSQFFVGDEVNDGPKLAAYALVRAGVDVRWRSFTLYARVFNLLDTAHETFGTFSVNGRVTPPVTEPFLTPGLPRRFVAGLRWEL